MCSNLRCPDGDGVPTTTTRKHIVPADPTAATSVIEMFCKIGRANGEIQLVVWSSEDTLPVASAVYDLEAADYRPLPSASRLVVALGASPNLQRACSQNRNAKGLIAVVSLSEKDRLPSQSLGYDGVDEVFLSGSRPALLKLLQEKATLRALGDWIQRGGRLVISIGGEEAALLGEQGPLQRFFSGRLVESVPIRELQPLEVLAGGSDPLMKENDRGQRESFVVPSLEIEKGHVLSVVQHGGRGLPLLLVSSMGFGQVTLLAVDVEQPEFTSWNGTRNLIRNILSVTDSAEQKGKRANRGELAHAGYDDLAGQLRAALDQFEEQGVWFIPFELLFLCGIVYLLLIAPGDYLFLKRLRGKMELTWISFPLIVILCSLAVYIAARTTKGDQLLINQAEVVDIDTLTGQVRGACWFSLFSPQTQRFDLSAACRLPIRRIADSDQQVPHSDLDSEVVFSWMGLPGTGLGGMESPLVAPLFERGYRYGSRLSSLEQVPLSIWSTKCFSIRYSGSVSKAMDATLSEKNAGDDALLEGSITSRLEYPLRNCVLLHNGWAYPLGTLEPNQTHPIDRDQSVRTIRNYLARLGPMEMESETERYQISRIFERVLLYRTSGGSATIPLENNYLHVLDMSHLLESREAVLMGQVDQSSFKIDNQGQALTDAQSLRGAIYRFVLPVRHFDSKRPTTTSNPKDTAPSSHSLLASEDP